MGLSRFKRRVGWVDQGFREGYNGFSKVKGRIGWVYQGLREG